MKRATIAIALVALSACTLGPLTEIPCTSDDTCPTSYFCGSVGSCVLEDGEKSPPKLAFEGVRLKYGPKDAPFTNSITFSSSEKMVAIEARLTNAGGSPVAYPKVTLSGEACLGIDQTLQDNQTGIVQANTSALLQFYADPEKGCSGTFTVRVKMTVKDTNISPERIFDGEFSVVATP